MITAEELITKARSYISLLNEFKEGNKEYYRLFEVLDRLKLDPNYTLALHLPNDKIFLGDVSWFYCYKGGTDSYCDRYNNPDEDENEDFWQCYGKVDENEILNHIFVEQTIMGAWQIYLLYIATTQLPAYRHGSYRSTNLIFSNEDVRKYHPLATEHLRTNHIKKELNYPEEQLLPEISFEGNTAYVKCCYFNLWSGVMKETIAFTFEGNRVTEWVIAKKEVIYKYQCRILY